MAREYAYLAYFFWNNADSSSFFGRIYCGWLCPINTVTSPINWLVKKLGYKHLHVAKILSTKFLSWSILGLLAMFVMISRTTGFNIPILLLILGLGAILTFIFQPEIFHKYVCPYGALQGVVGKFAKMSYTADKRTCNGCGKYKSVCEAGAITVENKKAAINKRSCLQCGLCEISCPKDAIVHKNSSMIGCPLNWGRARCWWRAKDKTIRWCPRPESNWHEDEPQRILSPLRLPIPPLGLI
jgi:ferredoxin-type protein NapH